MQINNKTIKINLPTEGMMISGQDYFDFLLFKANIVKGKEGTDIGNVIKAKLGSMKYDTLDAIKRQLPVIVALLFMIEEVEVEPELEPVTSSGQRKVAVE